MAVAKNANSLVLTKLQESLSYLEDHATIQLQVPEVKALLSEIQRAHERINLLSRQVQGSMGMV